MQLNGTPVKLEIVTVSGEAKVIDSQQYRVTLIDQQGKPVEIEVLGLEKIPTTINHVNMNDLVKLFNICPSQIKRADGKEIDILVGLQYAGFHPICIETVGHLLLLQNRFGHIIAGSHPNVKEATVKLVKHATVLHVSGSFDKFFSIEGLGISCQPRCGACKCGRCHPGGSDMSLRDERELRQIESNVKFNKQSGRWSCDYP